MAWYDEAVFYHIYPLGLTGAPEKNPYGEPVHRLREIFPWIDHVKEIGCSAIYIGPLFESVGHGYETTDYKKLDSRLGDNEDLKEFVRLAHEKGIRVILDGVFNHTGRDFFAMADIRKNRENSPYRDWYRNVNFWGNNEFNDGFSYDNWGGYNIMAKLNQQNPVVRDYICDVIRFWVSEFDIDGIRLDAADVLDFSFMQALRQTANQVKADFWLMGEVIHGDYTRWVNEGTLHAVTNYHLHKALYSGHNEHNYFEIAHTVKRLYGMGGNRPDGLKLYDFVDNHDVERIASKLANKAHYKPVHILLYTLPGVPSIYYGSEFGIEGKKTYGTDAPLRPCLHLEEILDGSTRKPKDPWARSWSDLITELGRIRRETPALSYGAYKELVLTNRQYAFARELDGKSVMVAVNNDEKSAWINLPANGAPAYVGALSGRVFKADNGRISLELGACDGDVLVPTWEDTEACKAKEETKAETGQGVKEETKEETEQGIKEETKAETEQGVKEETKAETGQGVKEETKAETEQGVMEETKVETEQGVKEETKVETEREAQEDEAENKRNPKAEIKQEGKEEAKTEIRRETREEVQAEIRQEAKEEVKAPEIKEAEQSKEPYVDLSQTEGKSYESMSIEELQSAILYKMSKNGPVTDQMLRSVRENVYPNSLLNWVKSFR